MKTKIIASVLTAGLLLALTPSFKSIKKNPLDHTHVAMCGTKGCAFKTLFSEEDATGFATFKTEETVEQSMQDGLIFLAKSQQQDGGWGAGSHSAQHIRDPHAVGTDPATTAMAGMAFIRSGSSLKTGAYTRQLNGALHYLLKAVEQTPKDHSRITDLIGTQIQTKLGQNIDAVMAAQFFNNVLTLDDMEPAMQQRVKAALTKCVGFIEMNQSADGSTEGDGWAGVLQSSFANQALEAAALNEVVVDDKALRRAKEFQKKNYDASTGKVDTERGAGVILYAVSGSVRASAKEAAKAQQLVNDAVKSGKLKDGEVTQQALEKLGLDREEAAHLSDSYAIYQSAKDQAQRDDVLTGFGNNGGEEFLSFLQTGESLVIAGGDDWKKWYDNMAGRILQIQNEDGSWNGHHCITSPVFCTATSLLILSIDKDVDRLRRLGDS